MPPNKRVTAVKGATAPPSYGGVASAVGNFFGTTGGQTPAGMSQLFWDTINKSPEAEAIRKQRSVIGATSGDPDAVIRQKIDALIAQKWAALPPEKQEEFHAQDKRGSPNVPGTPAYEAEKDADRATANTERDETSMEAYLGGPQAALQDAAAKAALGDQAAIETLRNLMGSITDPEIKAYVGDYIAQGATAGPSQRAIDDQRKEYEKLSANTGLAINAEERLMMEMARQKQEQDLRSQRGAFANSLQERGVYGSGAELAMNLAQSSEYAQRRAIEEMTAQAHAEERSRLAIEKANEVAGNIRTAETEEDQYRATAADRAKEFNNTLRDGYERWVTEEKRKFNEDKVDRNFKLFQGETGVNREAVARQASVADNAIAGLTGGSGIRRGNLQTELDAKKRLRNEQVFEEGQDARF